MHKFTYTPNPDNPHDYVTIDMSTSHENLHEVIKAFESYLRAAGFVFDGELDIFNNEGSVNE